MDDVAEWTITCVVVRGGHRRQGVVAHLLEGAVEWARSQGAPAVEAHPVDTCGERMDTTTAFVGTTSTFDRVGFSVVGQTDALASRRPRLVVRRVLAPR